MHPVIKQLAISLLIFVTVALTPAHHAQGDPSKREAYLRAAIIAGILRYTHIVATTENTLCSVGTPASLSVLRTSYQHIEINGAAVRLTEPRRPEELQQCQVIVAGTDLPRTIFDALVANRPKTALLICDNCNLPQQAPDIRLFTENDKIRFSVTRDTGEKAAIRYDSALLELAASIDDRERMR